MIEEINKTIREAVAEVYARRKVANYDLQEPDYTVALAIEFPRLLNEKAVMPNVKYGGCFIHQSPKVTFNIPRVGESSCELGDLLVLLRKRTMDDTRYNAALVQLKKSEKSRFNVTNNRELNQLYLYEKWPEFTMSSTNLEYDVFPKAVTQGALYCIIKRTPELMLYMAEPMKKMEYSGEMTFGRFIRDAIHWQTGRTVSDEAHKDSDVWSRLIWELVQNVRSKAIHEGVFTRTNVGYTDHDKLSDDFLEFMLNSDENDAISANVNHLSEGNTKKDFSNGGGTPTNEDSNMRDNEGMGISILFIDIDDREKGEERGEQRR